MAGYNLSVRLGELSARSESGTMPWRVAHSRLHPENDFYGAYRFDAKSDMPGDFVNWVKYHEADWLKNDMGEDWKALRENSTGSPEFNKAWDNIGTQNKAKWLELQSEYTKEMYYDVAVKNLENAGIQIPDNFAFHQAVMAAAVGNGPDSVVKLWREAEGQSYTKDHQVDEQKLLENIYKVRYDLAPDRKGFLELEYKNAQDMYNQRVSFENMEREAGRHALEQTNYYVQTTAQEQDTYLSLSQQYGVSEEALKAYNQDAEIKEGTTILIPVTEENAKNVTDNLRQGDLFKCSSLAGYTTYDEIQQFTGVHANDLKSMNHADNNAILAQGEVILAQGGQQLEAGAQEQSLEKDAIANDDNVKPAIGEQGMSPVELEEPSLANGVSVGNNINTQQRLNDIRNAKPSQIPGVARHFSKDPDPVNGYRNMAKEYIEKTGGWSAEADKEIIKEMLNKGYKLEQVMRAVNQASPEVPKLEDSQLKNYAKDLYFDAQKELKMEGQAKSQTLGR